MLDRLVRTGRRILGLGPVGEREEPPRTQAEPAEPVAVAMIRGLVGTLEKHHKVRILDEAVRRR